MPHLSQAEFNERVDILRRYKQALMRQRDRFRSYLTSLEARGASENLEDDLEFHVEMEQSIVKEIASFERTIEPLETLYRAHAPEDAQEIPSLREALYRTRDEVLRRTEHNQRILREQLAAIRDEVTSLRRTTRSLAGANATYPDTRPSGGTTLIDVTA
jgi:biopolymer transport protein ExbB/TolQ